MSLDAFDTRILDLLQQEGRIAVVDLAERVNLSATACHKRIRNLEDRGVITGYHAAVAPKALGFQMEAFVAVTIERQVKAEADAFKASASKINGVRAVYLLSGDTDFLLHVVAADLEHYTRVVLSEIMTLPGAKAVRTSFVLDKAAEVKPLAPLARNEED